MTSQSITPLLRYPRHNEDSVGIAPIVAGISCVDLRVVILGHNFENYPNISTERCVVVNGYATITSAHHDMFFPSKEHD